uniref:Protein preY, mitochondrial n=1 Tax=Peronospora matthiolae TaxID=2874970 RepID=A0AAV1SZH4_9STRA
MKSVGRLTSRVRLLVAQVSRRDGPKGTLLLTRRMIATVSRFDQPASLVDESAMDHLVCPISKYPLRYDTERGSLVCDQISVEYPIWYGVPVLVPSEGRIVEVLTSGEYNHDHEEKLK